MRRALNGWGLLFPGFAVVAAFVVVPLVIVALYSVAVRLAPGSPWPEGFTGAQFLRLLDPLYVRIFVRSFAQAGVATLLCLGLSYPLAYYIAQSPVGRRSRLLLLVTIPFWTNFLVRTYALIVLMRAQGVVNTLLTSLGIIRQPLGLLYNEGAVQLGLVYTLLPLMVLPLYANLEKLDNRLVEAAWDLGATPWRAFWQVTWPLSRPGVVAGSVMVFISAFGIFLVPDLMGGARAIMVGNLIQNQFLQARNWPFGAAVALVLAALVLVLGQLLQRRALVGEGGRR